MSEHKSKSVPEPKAAMLTPDTLKETLGELALNIDSLVDNLTMGMPDPDSGVDVVTEHPAEELPAEQTATTEQDSTPVSLARMAAAASRPTFASGQTVEASGVDDDPVSPETGAAVADDSELVGLVEGLIDSVETHPRDAAGNRFPETVADGETTAQCLEVEEPETTELSDDTCAPDVPAVGVDAKSPESIEAAQTDEVAIENAPEQDATTAGVIPWSAPEAATQSSGGGALWKIAAAIAAVGILGGGWFLWNGRGENAAEPTTRPARVNQAVPFTASTAPNDSSPGVNMASMASLATSAKSTPGESEDAKLSPVEVVPVDVASVSEPPETTVPQRTARGNPVAATVVPESEPEIIVRDLVAAAPKTPAPTPAPIEPVEVASNVPAEPVWEPRRDSVPTDAPIDPEPVATPLLSELPEDVPAPAEMATIEPVFVAITTDASAEQQPDLPEETAPPQIDPPSDVVAARGDSGPMGRIFEPPKLIRRGTADYSERSRKKGERGVVELLLLVDPTGHVKRVIIEQGMPGSDLEASAISAALQSSYEPATSGGQPVEAWANERFVFEP